MNIEDLRKRILNKNFYMTYKEAINFESPEELNYEWLYSTCDPLESELLYVSVELFGNIKILIQDAVKQFEANDE